jgi:hypothetical protein
MKFSGFNGSSFGYKPASNIVPPVLAGTVSVGASPTITPGIWSVNSTSRVYTLLRGANAIPGLEKVSKSTIESYQYSLADFNQNIIVLEHALLGGNYAASNSVIGNLFSAVALLTTTNTYSAAGTVPNCPAGSSSMTIATVWRKITATNTSFVNQNLVHRYSSGVSGFRLTVLDANGTSGRVRQISYATSNAPAQVFTSNLQTVAFTPTQNFIQRSVYVLTGGVLYSYVNKTLIASINCTGYTSPSNAVPFLIGTISGATDEWELVSVSINESAGMDQSEIDAWDDIVTGFGSRQISGATHHWEASDAGATWEDQIQGVSLTRNGSPIVRTFAPQFE